jgi:hypothetical protein
MERIEAWAIFGVLSELRVANRKKLDEVAG